MGADVDVTGTSLAAGVSATKLSLSFQNRDVKGSNKLPLDTWIHIAYTYNLQAELGAVYINGKLDKALAQKPYAGPLDMIGSALGFGHGKFAMDDVLVTRNCMSSTAIAELAAKGIKALQNAQLVTDWEPVNAQVKLLKTWADIPAGAGITVIAESAGKDGIVIDSDTFKLTTGMQSISLAKLKPGAQVRLRVQLSSGGFKAVPVLQTALIDDTIRWSTAQEWQKSTASGGLLIGQ
jgi:hypothetical protein